MTIEEGIDSHTYFFWEFCKVVSRDCNCRVCRGDRDAALLRCLLIITLTSGTAIALATMLASVQTWFVCRSQSS